MSSKVEQLVVLRRRWLAGSLVGLTLWMGATILQNLVLDNRQLQSALALISVVGAGVWMTYLWRINGMQLRLREDRTTSAALDDELVRANRMKAAFFALMVTLLFQGILIAVLALQPHLLSGLVTAQASLLVGNVAFIGAFLYLDSREG